MKLTTEDRQQILRKMFLNRQFEERVLDEYEDNGIPELPHLSMGQEAVGVGGCYPLDDNDWIAPSLRTRAVMLMRVPLKTVAAGMYGTVSGPSKGRTTQHHMGSTEHGVLGTTGLVGSHLNVAVGAGLNSQVLNQERVSLVFFGDGATTRGEFYTATNYAAARNLPVIFLIENNGWTEETPIEAVTAVDNLVDMVGHDMKKEIVDGQDADAVAETVGEAAEHARSGGGPTLIEAKTYRFRPHAEVIEERRPEEELAEWRQRDPVEIYRERLIEEGVVDEEWIEETEAELQTEVNDAFEFAKNDDMPEEEAMFHVYKDTEIDRNGGVVR